MSFTPREAFRFAAKLKLKANEKERERRVEELLKDLGLLHVADV